MDKKEALEFNGSILWNDSDWKIENPILSEKDLVSPGFDGFVSPFK